MDEAWNQSGWREETAARAAAGLREASGRSIGALVGFDGFIDEIIRVVDHRRSMRMEDFEPIATIEAFAGRCAAAAGRSANLELVMSEARAGGNGPLLASALASLGMRVDFIGAIGRGDGSGGLAVHPVYESFAAGCRSATPIAEPGLTHALEFEDGKIMLGRTEPVQVVTWECLVAMVGRERLAAMVSSADLLGVVNWTLVGGVQGIFEGLARDLLPTLERKPRRLMIDISDPAKRTDEDVRGLIGVLGELGGELPVSLGLNLSEATRLGAVLGTGSEPGEVEEFAGTLPVLASEIRQAIGIDCVVIHPTRGAAGADAAGERGWFLGPFTRRPVLSTGAGDHFNGGFAFAQTLGLGLGECLAAGCATSGAYVRDAASPTLDRIAGLLERLPAPE